MSLNTASVTCPVRAPSACAVCPTARHCLLQGASPAEAELWHKQPFQQIPLATAGAALFEASSRADAIYSVRAGCLRSFTVDQDGNERVRGFHLPGDLIGLDALTSGSHPAAAAAVVSSQVCRIPRTQLLALLETNPRIVRNLLDRTSNDLAVALALAGDYTADQRMAAFLLYMRERLAPSPMPASTNVRLPMTRRDVANYLRLATETVCRVLARFEQQRLVKVADKLVQLLDPAALSSLAQPVGISRSRGTLAATA